MSDRRLLVLRAGRHKAFGGLSWRDTPGDSPSEMREQVRSAAESFRSRHGLILESTRTEVGFVPDTAQKEARSGVSAAAWLASVSSAPTLFIQTVESGFWVVFVDQGYIDPRTDEVCNEEDARGLVDSILDAMAMQSSPIRVVVDGDRKPSSAMLDRFSEIESKTFQALVAGSSPPATARIRQLVGITPAAILGCIFVLALIAAAWVGYIAYDKWQKQRAFEAQRAAMAMQEAEAARLRNEAELRMKLAVDTAAAQDTQTPNPDDIVRNCLSRVQALGSGVGGWAIQNAICDPAGASISVTLLQPATQMNLGTTGSLITDAEARGFSVNVTPSNGQATLTIPMQAPQKRPALKPAQLPAYNAVLRSLMSRLQLAKQSTRALNYTLTGTTPRVATYVDPELESKNDASRFKQVPAERTYLKGSMTLDGVGSWTAGAISIAYPFVSLTKAQLAPSSKGLTWHVEAEYVTNH